VSIALDTAGASSGAGDIEVGLAEVDGVPVVPASIKSLEDLVTLLDIGSDVDLPRHVLSNAGVKGARALVAKLPTMGDRGKALAVDILESLPCKAASAGLARLAWDAPKKTATTALTLLDGCGVEAKEAVVAAFEAGPTAANVTLASRYARLDPKGALVALLALGPASPPARRATYRTALGRVVATTAGRDAVVAWLAAHTAERPAAGAVDPVIELARAIAPVSDVTQPTTEGTLLAPLSRALIEHAGPTQPFDRQWLAAAPIASLARHGDVPSLAWIRALFHHPDRYLRARAAEVSADVDPLRPELVTALSDKEPRVREKSLEALRSAGGGGALSPVMGILASDAWTFVRVAAAELLGDASTGGKDVDLALAKATSDPHKRVRSAALRSLASRHATSQLPVIRARAFDSKEVVEVRREAIEALGKLCDRASADDLYEIAKRAADSDGAMQLALSAIMALGDIHPPDLQARLTALNLNTFVLKDAVNRALKTVSTCK
jgi:HEAT repeat protein